METAYAKFSRSLQEDAKKNQQFAAKFPTGKGWEVEDLDEVVHAQKASEASRINNQGRESQARYLVVECGVTD